MTEKKKRVVAKRPYFVEECVDGAYVGVINDAFDDTAEAERWIRENADDLKGKTLRIVCVCKRVTVNTITTTSVVLASA